MSTPNPNPHPLQSTDYEDEALEDREKIKPETPALSELDEAEAEDIE